MAAGRPNILLVMTDSSRRDTLSCYGAAHAVSPCLDRLAAEGARFEQAHTSAPVCTPARASLLTGTHTPVHGCVENGIARRPDLVTLPKLLGRAGYHTIMVGKTHFGGPAAFDDESVLGGEKGAEVEDDYARHLAAHGFGRASAHPNPIPPDLFCDAFLVDRTIEGISRHRTERPAQPFFAFCSLPSPHSPLDPPGEWAALFDGVDLPRLNYTPGEEDRRPAHLEQLVGRRGVEAEQQDGSLDLDAVDRQRRLYYGSAAYCDAQVGRLVGWLDANELRDDTLVVFTTDHGQQYYDHGFNDKHTFYDESWRIPLIVRLPGVIAAGSVRDWAMTTDLTATFAAVAGVDAPMLQGFNLLGPPARTCAASVLHRSLALATDEWKLEYYPEHATGRLFDRRTDPHEQHDIWAERVEVRRQLLEALLAWRADLTDVQYLQEHTHHGGPVAQRVAAQTARRTGLDAELRLSRRVRA
ncbi:sulfatase-like hydrolase/transferase [Kribbella sp. NPDC051137]|uniref:sulfatase family protein n=1 Tax=Kribbella sp. NPDC051137 TaxID=3155045 RepID=UPI002F6C2075